MTQNDRFVVLLTMQADQLGSGQYVVADPLPAGFEIENPNLANMAGIGDFGWLSVNTPSHVESRTDQYIAAFRYGSDAQCVLDRLRRPRRDARHLRAPGRDRRGHVPARVPRQHRRLARSRSSPPAPPWCGAARKPNRGRAEEPAADDHRGRRRLGADGIQPGQIEGLADRKVRTVLVSPDGTIVP